MSHPKIISIIIICSLMIISLASAMDVVPYCVANLTHQVGPAGYPCKTYSKVTADEFVYTGLRVPRNGSKLIPFNVEMNLAVDTTFPGVNGLGISMARSDLGVGGAVPFHSHPVSEIIYVVEGTVVSGFIGTDSKAYYKTIKKGDVMIIPASLHHFAVNAGKTPAFLLSAWNSAGPGFHMLAASIAMNGLPTEIIQKTTLLDVQQIHKLKKIFGGSN